MKRAAIFLLAALAFSTAHAALPPAVEALAPAWRALGQGEMRWFGFSLYNAALWVSGEQMDETREWERESEMRRPYALALHYKRDFTRERLVDTSIDEIRRLGTTDEALLARWRSELNLVFPDVRSGQTIVGVRLPGEGARFFFEGRVVGALSDERFARAFFAIWLDSRTRSPELRARLLGAAQP